MSILTMNMSSYEIERDEAVVPGYGDEILYVGLIPGLACHRPHAETAALSADLAAVDVDAFLRKMYTFQR